MRTGNPGTEIVARSEPEHYFLAEALTSLAGNLAEQRARRGSGNGWTPVLDDDAVRSYHEAGHAVVAIACGLFVLHASILPNPGIHVGQRPAGGHVVHARTPDAKMRLPAQLEKDHTQAARAAWLLTPFDAPRPRWRHVLRTVRALHFQASQIVEQNWLFIAALACELQRVLEMDRAAIERIVMGRMADA